MRKTINNYVYGSNVNSKSTFTIPILPVQRTNVVIGLFTNTIGKIDWGDGSITNGDFSNLSYQSHNYTSLSDRNIIVTVAGGLSNVKEFKFNSAWRYNLNFGDFLKQFPRLQTVNISTYYATGYESNGYMTLTGGLESIPDTVENLIITNLSTTSKMTLNCNNFSSSSQLKKLVKNGSSAAFDVSFFITGDLSKIPAGINYLAFTTGSKISPNSFSYTPGRVWAKSIDRISLTRVGLLNTTMIDNILNDLKNSVEIAIGEKIIEIYGTRTSASDTAVLYLQQLGFTVTITA